MKIDLTGQEAVVIGGAKGIGAAIVRSFLDAGANVTAIDIDDDALGKLKEKKPDNLQTIIADITDESALKKLASARTVHHLICAAAIGSGKAGFPFWKMEPQDWKQVVEVTLMGTVNSLHAFVPSLLKGNTGQKSVLILSSVAGQIGSQTDPPYSACKGR